MWLLSQSSDSIKEWVRVSKHPLVVIDTLGERILWANFAFEELLGYSNAELCGEVGPTWKTLTGGIGDLETEEKLIASMIEDKNRGYYSLRKDLISKSRERVSVKIHATKWPPNVEAQYILVDVIPIGAKEVEAFILDIQNFVLALTRENIVNSNLHNKNHEILTSMGETVNILSQNMTDISTVFSKPTTMDIVKEWAKTNPTKFYILLVVAITFLFGERVIEIIERIISIKLLSP